VATGRRAARRAGRALKMADETSRASAAADEPVLEWALRSGAGVHPALALRQSPEAGRGWFAQRALPAGAVLLRVPLRLCLVSPTREGSAHPASDGAERGGVDGPSWWGGAGAVAAHLMGVRPPLSPACSLPVLLAYLLCLRDRYQHLDGHVEDGGEAVAAQHNLGGWWVYSWLGSWFGGEQQSGSSAGRRRRRSPEAAALEQHGIYLGALPLQEELDVILGWSDAALSALEPTSLGGRACRERARRDVLRGCEARGQLLSSEAEDYGLGMQLATRQAIASFLVSALPAPMREETASVYPAEPAARSPALGTGEAGRYLAHAVLISKRRSFVVPPQRAGISDRSCQRGGDSGSVAGRRLLVPLIDYVNHSADPRAVCSTCRYEPPAAAGARDDAATGAAVSGAGGEPPAHQMPGATHKNAGHGGYVTLVATKDIPAGKELFFDYGSFSSAECLERFGFADQLADTAPGGRAPDGSRADDAGSGNEALPSVRGVPLPLAERAVVPMAAVLYAIGQPAVPQNAGGGARPSHEVIMVGHPHKQERGLNELQSRLKPVFGECTAEELRTMAAASIEWTLRHGGWQPLEEERQLLRAAETELALDAAILPAESTDAADAVDEAPPYLASALAEAAIEHVAEVIGWDALPSPRSREPFPWELGDGGGGGGGGGEMGGWAAVQVRRVRVRECAVLTGWLDQLRAGTTQWSSA
jgi:hypothetical protein